MKTQIQISNSLRIDLKEAFDFNTDFNSRTTGEWIYAIDPENMNELKSHLKNVDGSLSLNRLAYLILRNTI